jgi:hypothetical protein
MSDYIIRETATASGNTTSWNGLGRQPPAIQRQDIHITGTFDSAVCKLQYSIDGGSNWVDVPADKEANLVTLSAAGIMTVKQRWPLLRVNIASAGGSASLVILVV